MNQVEVMKQALDMLENHSGNYKLNDAECDKHGAAVDALHQAIEQAEKQEPIGSVTSSPWRGLENIEWQQQRDIPEGTHMLYLHPPAPPTAPAQQPLSDQRILELNLLDFHEYEDECIIAAPDEELIRFARAIEAHIKGEAK